MRFVQRPLCVSVSLATALLSVPLSIAAQTPAVSQTSSSLSTVPADRLSQTWWADRHKAILAALPDHSDTQLLLIGDSITNNYDKSEPPSENFQPLWQQYYAPRKALNLGFSGDTTSNVLWRLDHGEVQGLQPKLSILLIGTNNTAQHQTAQQTEAGIDAVVSDLEQHLPNTKILLLGILPTALPSKDINFDVNSYLSTHYASGSDPNVTYLDIGSVFYSDGSLNDALFYDPHLSPPQPALHPTPLGQRLMASAIEPIVARLMGDTPVKPSLMPMPLPPKQP